jgi:hypothetical protein
MDIRRRFAVDVRIRLKAALVQILCIYINRVKIYLKIYT